jgi:hypothetical protein
VLFLKFQASTILECLEFQLLGIFAGLANVGGSNLEIVGLQNLIAARIRPAAKPKHLKALFRDLVSSAILISSSSIIDCHFDSSGFAPY